MARASHSNRQLCGNDALLCVLGNADSHPGKTEREEEEEEEELPGWQINRSTDKQSIFRFSRYPPG
ncbi:hypothetical protein EYF80_010663 [Liparis tanakae]|uniref:Uncharacterized protein n=1 Tax=Liparis tanakae TaxID=230148 RepID=A0A4Z2INC4_9TELE|nr:hypothetical protein EYF80_010663 [Liparis tanakae]